jgi:hypothetical protein
MRDLMGRYHTTLQSPIVSAWNGTTRPGGYYDISFDGATTSSFLDCGNDNALNPTNAVTYSAWVRFAITYPGSVEWWVLARDDNSLGRAYSFGVDTTGRFRLQLGGADVTGATFTVAPHVWYHIAATFSFAESSAIFYVNGEQTGTFAVSSIASTTGSTTIGKRTYSGFQGYLNGSVGEAGIWNRTLTKRDIHWLYNESYLGYPNGLNRYQTSPAAFAGSAPIVPAPYYYRMLQAG